ncbi:unnamed protein product [Calypogeia fissa]
MTNNKNEYMKKFEQSDVLLPHTWIVIRIDGRGFTHFAQVHEFEKPNDMQALHLVNECAKAALEDIPDIVLAYGVSDEFSFVLRKTTTLYRRQSSKKGSLVFRRREESVVKIENGVPITRARSNLVVVHEDMIRDSFWNENPFILNVSGVSSKKVKPTVVSSNERGGRAVLQRFSCSDQT